MARRHTHINGMGRHQLKNIVGSMVASRESIQTEALTLGQKKKIVVFRYPDRPYFFAPTLKIFQTFGSNFTMVYYKNEILV